MPRSMGGRGAHRAMVERVGGGGGAAVDLDFDDQLFTFAKALHDLFGFKRIRHFEDCPTPTADPCCPGVIKTGSATLPQVFGVSGGWVQVGTGVTPGSVAQLWIQGAGAAAVGDNIGAPRTTPFLLVARHEWGAAAPDAQAEQVPIGMGNAAMTQFCKMGMIGSNSTAKLSLQARGPSVTANAVLANFNFDTSFTPHVSVIFWDTATLMGGFGDLQAGTLVMDTTNVITDINAIPNVGCTVFARSANGTTAAARNQFIDLLGYVIEPPV